MQTTHITDTIAASTGTGTVIAASYQLSDVGIMVGIVFTILSFCTSLFFHIRRERRAVNEAMHKGRMWKARKDRALRNSSKRES